MGFEIMANSDNVLRGGLTPKHVDVPELLRVLDFTPTDEKALKPQTVEEGIELSYDTPAPEFAMSVVRLDGGELGRETDVAARHDGPQVLLCTEGTVQVHAKSSTLTLDRGRPRGWPPTTDPSVCSPRSRPRCSAPRSASEGGIDHVGVGE